MILRRIALEQWRCFEREEAFELRPGLNVIHGHNEAGKSTILEALARAFYEKYKVGGADIAAIQPVGRSVAPRVTIEFEAERVHYRIEKRFIKHPSSKLSRLEHGEWRVFADAEEADQNVRDLVHGGDRGRERALSPEARGLAQALWLLQRDSSDLPYEWTPQVRQGLGGLVEVAAETPEASRFASALEKQYLEWFTSKGSEKRGGPIANAREVERQAKEELESLLERENAIQGLRERLEREEEEARILRKEAEHHDTTVEQASKAASDADIHEKSLEAAIYERDEADSESKTLEKTLESLRARQEKAALLRSEIESIERDARYAEADSKNHLAFRQEMQELVDVNRVKVRSLRKRLDALEAALRRRMKVDQLEKLHSVVTEIGEAQQVIQEEQKRLAALAAPDAKVKAAYDQADRDLAAALAARKASAITVSFHLREGAEIAKTLPSVSAGKDGIFLITRETTFDLGNFGSVVVGGGGQGVAELDASIVRHQEDTATLLGGLTPEEFLRRHFLGEEIRKQLGVVTANLEALVRKHPRLDSEIALLSTEIAGVTIDSSLLDEGWETLGTSALDVLRVSVAEDLKDAEAELGMAEARERTLLTESSSLAERVGEAKNLLVRHQAGIAHEDAEAASIIQRYGNKEALLAAAEAKAMMFDSYKAKVDDLEKLRWARVEAPRQEERRALEKQKELWDRAQVAERAARDIRSALRQEVKDGFHERIAGAEERLHGLSKQREIAERRGRGLELLYRLYVKRKEEQGETLRAPVAKLVVPWLRYVTDERYEGLHIDDRLMPTGLHGKRLEGVLPLGSVSHGMREQIVLLVRLALARLVAEEKPFPVVIDDRLVNADRVRMDRMGLILQKIAETGQVVVATCDPTRYDGLGAHMIALGENSRANEVGKVAAP